MFSHKLYTLLLLCVIKSKKRRKFMFKNYLIIIRSDLLGTLINKIYD